MIGEHKLMIGGIFTVWKGTPGDMELCGKFHNHVTDYGLDSLVDTPLDDLMTTLHVGSGNTAPADSDLTLSSEIASTTTKTVNSKVSSSSKGYIGRRRKFQFAAGVAEGTLAELGLSDGTYLFNRQLFLDPTGNPTTISVGAFEVLEIMCEVRVYTPAPVETKVDCGNVVINGETYNHMCSFQSKFFNTQYSSYSVVPEQAFNSIFDPLTLNRVAAATTTVNYNDGSSGILASAGGPDVSNMTYDSYISGSFELISTLEWYPGVKTGRVDLILVGSQYGDYTAFIEIGLSPTYNQYAETPWAASTGYGLGNLMISALGDSHIYEVTTAGTSHTSAPTWPTTVGDTVTDGNGVVYECVAPLLVLDSSEGLELTVKISWGRVS